MKDKWIFDDAQFLKTNGRKRGCICLLLCMVDEYSKEYFPNEKTNRKRYTEYLKAKLQIMGIDKGMRIE